MAWNRDTTALGVAYNIIANDETAAGCNSAVSNLAKVSAAFAALTAVSAGIVVASDRVASLNEVASRSAYTYDMSTESMRLMAKSMSDASTPIDEVLSGIDDLSRSGVKVESLKTIFKEFDEIGKALGTSAPSAINAMVPALNALEIPLTDIAKYQDVFVHTVRNSNLELGEFSNMITRFSPSLKALGVDVYDVAAIFSTMQKHGIEGRRAMVMFSNAISEQTKAEEELATSKEKLIQLQEDLNQATERGSKTTRNYLEDIQASGRDVGQMRSLTTRYQRDMRDQDEEVVKKKTEMSTLQATVDKGGVPFNLMDTLTKLSGGKVTAEEVSTQKEILTALKGETDARAIEAEKYTTSQDKLRYSMDTLNQTIGEKIPPGVADVASYAGTAGGVISGVSGAASLYGKLAGVGSGGIAAGTGGAGAGAGGVATLGGTALAGAVLAGGVVGLIGTALLEKAGLLGLPEFLGGTGKGAVQEAGATVGGMSYKAGYDFMGILKELSAKTQAPPIRIEKVELSKDYPFSTMMEDMNRYQDNERKKSGVPT
jgi:hypothetical protein